MSWLLDGGTGRAVLDRSVDPFGVGTRGRRKVAPDGSRVYARVCRD